MDKVIKKVQAFSRIHLLGSIPGSGFKRPTTRNTMFRFGLKKFGGKRDLDWDGVPNSKDCQPRNPFRQDLYTVYKKKVKWHPGYIKKKDPIEGAYKQDKNITGRYIEISPDGRSYTIMNPDGREIQVLQDYRNDFLNYAYELGIQNGLQIDKSSMQAYYGSNPSRILVRW